jgi:hypothetical protein
LTWAVSRGYDADVIRALIEAGAAVSRDAFTFALSEASNDAFEVIVADPRTDEYMNIGLREHWGLSSSELVLTNNEWVKTLHLIHVGCHLSGILRRVAWYTPSRVSYRAMKYEAVYKFYVSVLCVYSAFKETQPLHIIEAMTCSLANQTSPQFLFACLLSSTERFRIVVAACKRTCKSRRALCAAVFPPSERLSAEAAENAVGAVDVAEALEKRARSMLDGTLY